MNNEVLTATYKCRLCGELYCEGNAGRAFATSHIFTMVAGRPSTSNIVKKENVHYCADGSLGLSDFQGWKVGDASG